MKQENELLIRARKLRSEATEAELKLWQSLRARQLHGFKFKRQCIIAPYIVDFISLDAALIIEADGGQHNDRLNYDQKRTAFLETRGFKVIRFWNNEILGQFDAVLERIGEVLMERPSPRPSPKGRGR